MASIKDVAKKAGVSISTVSYVISGTRPVSQKTKDLVHKTMEEIGYRPHAMARALASKKSRIIALMLSPQERALGITEMDLITTAAERAEELGYHLILWPASGNDIKDLEDLKGQGLVDGLILMEIQDRDPRVEWLQNSGMPYQIIGRCADNEGLFYTDIDFRTTVEEALIYLKGIGHSNVALINQSEEAFQAGYGPVIRVHRYFEESCKKLNLEYQRYFSHPAPSDGYRIMKDLASDSPGTTAVLVMNDQAISGILQCAADLDRKVPDDLSILSLVSSSRFAEMMVPALTEMEVPAVKLMSCAVESLIQRLEGDKRTENGQLWPCTLRVRGSSKENI